jgi:protein O-GlcNAc transferase
VAEARALYEAGRHKQASDLLHGCIARDPMNFEAHLLIAVISVEQQRWQDALVAAREAVALRASSASAWYALGRACKEIDDVQAALACYRRAQAIEPRNAAILTSLGTVLFGLGQRDRAARAYKDALAAHPGHSGARKSLDALLKPAAGGMQRVAEIREQAQVLHRSGKRTEALELHREALKIAPNMAGIWLSAGLLAYETGNPYASLPYFEEAVRLNPALLAAVEAARRMSVNAGLFDKAVHYSELAASLRPCDDIRISFALTIDAISPSREAIAAQRQAYEARIDAAAAAGLKVTSLPAAVGMHGFFLAYHGENDRLLQAKAARLLAGAAPHLTMTAPHCAEPYTRRPGKSRIGFISAFFYDHSIGKTSRGLIEQLSRDSFEVYAIRITPSKSDSMTEQLRRAADHMIVLDPDFATARAQLAELELDILFYQDIGMEPQSYLLAFARLAPVQCVSYGHPNTTGIPNMDYFISNDLYEPAGAADHYTEQLFLLHDLPTLAYYHRPVAPPGCAQRFSFGLRDQDHVYLCPQTPFKIHPEFDVLLQGILARDPHGVAVFIRLHYDDYIERLQERFARSLGEAAHRVVFLDPMLFPRFLQLLSIADVCLDTMHFNGMNSSLEAFSMGAPIVTFPGRMQRGRHTQAMYRKMGILDCIAKSPADYIDIAVRLGNDKCFADSIRRRILHRNNLLYEDPMVVREFERFFQHALRQARSGGHTAVVG